MVGRELEYINEAIARKHLSGNGYFTQLCQRFIEERLGRGRVLLTHSATAALEMAAILLDIGPGDEVIMPSWTFPSTANAFVLRGGVPVFVDIRADTLNIDETLVESAITSRTRAICVVHYAGVGAEMDFISAIAAQRGLMVIEDGAHAMFARWRGQSLGGLGDLAAFSFHETKPVFSGEGGALVVNGAAAQRRAEIVWEKGTNRLQFKRGETTSYTWVDVGSSFLPSEILAAFLYGQLEQGETVTARRVRIWQQYYEGFADLETEGILVRPACADAEHNGSIFYLLVADAQRRPAILRYLRDAGIGVATHYVPLHNSPAGRRFGRVAGPMTRTEDVALRLFRLPLHGGLTPRDQDFVIDAVRRAFVTA